MNWLFLSLIIATVFTGIKLIFLGLCVHSSKNYEDVNSEALITAFLFAVGVAVLVVFFFN